MAHITSDISAAADALKRGELVAFATETVYGLGGVALWPETVARIFEVKGRPTFDPLIVHLPELSHVERYVTHIPPVAPRWPTASGRVRSRWSCPKFPRSRIWSHRDSAPWLCEFPLTRWLSNCSVKPGSRWLPPVPTCSGRVSPTTAQHVADQLGDRIDWILDGGPCAVGVESTVLAVPDSGRPTLLRPGASRSKKSKT